MAYGSSRRLNKLWLGKHGAGRRAEGNKELIPMKSTAFHIFDIFNGAGRAGGFHGF
jgi:hypothetical protein